MINRLRNLDINTWTTVLAWLALACLAILLLASAVDAADTCATKCPPNAYYRCIRVYPFWTWCRCWLR